MKRWRASLNPSRSPGTVGVPNGVLDVLVPEVVLQAARIDALVGQLVAADVPKHVRVHWEGDFGGFAEADNHAAEARRTHGRAPPTIKLRPSALPQRASAKHA